MGPSNDTVKQQQQIEQTQNNIATTENQESQQTLAQGMSLMQPQINLLQAITGGNKNAAFSAVAPQVSTITQQSEATKGSILENLAPGAARDTALANLQMGTGSQVSNLMANEQAQAPGQLASIGSGLTGFSLSQIGAALNGLSSASSSNQAVGQMQAASSAGIMNILGSLVGAAGTALGGGSLGKLFAPTPAVNTGSSGWA